MAFFVASAEPLAIKICLTASILSAFDSVDTLNNSIRCCLVTLEENSSAFMYKYVFLFSIISPPTCFPNVFGSPKASK